MKLLVTLCSAACFLASCSSNSGQSTQEKAVTEFIKKNLDDPSSYQAARWGHAEPITFGEINKTNRTIAHLRYSIDSTQVHHDSISHIKTLEFDKHITFKGSEILKRKSEHIYDSIHSIHLLRRDSTRSALKAVGSLNDNTPAGNLITHAFRAKNKMGALVLDSARYFVHSDGKVELWNSFKKEQVL